MRAQWVCSRERRIALYKRSSINQSITSPPFHFHISTLPLSFLLNPSAFMSPPFHFHVSTLPLSCLHQVTLTQLTPHSFPPFTQAMSSCRILCPMYSTDIRQVGTAYEATANSLSQQHWQKQLQTVSANTPDKNNCKQSQPTPLTTANSLSQHYQQLTAANSLSQHH